MFDSMVFSTKQKRRTRRWLTVPTALILHAVVFGGLIIASFMTVESVPPPPDHHLVRRRAAAPAAAPAASRAAQEDDRGEAEGDPEADRAGPAEARAGREACADHRS